MCHIHSLPTNLSVNPVNLAPLVFPGPGCGTVEQNTNYYSETMEPNQTVSYTNVASMTECMQLCASSPTCAVWTFGHSH